MVGGLLKAKFVGVGVLGPATSALFLKVGPIGPTGSWSLLAPCASFAPWMMILDLKKTSEHPQKRIYLWVMGWLGWIVVQNLFCFLQVNWNMGSEWMYCSLTWLSNGDFTYASPWSNLCTPFIFASVIHRVAK